ncbi:MAG: 3,4-dihydroxy-2-butanone-4-phosphate synthase [Proteobacteria bacterium]|nr:3,4-dihydroxy-2-butanone-4-phosphate synthase [Pseudomonadota bacterium]
MPAAFLSTIEEVVEDARNGRMFILIDEEDRENEGDLIIPAQMATPEAINFMAKHGRGLICLTLTSRRVKELDLPLMSRENLSRQGTAFTISIEAKEGVSTGISAHDRAHTVSVAIDAGHGKDDIASPGHVFPLVARDGGVLVRAGHTEASVDIARLAGLNPSAVICEIMNDDGTMARLPDLIKFAQFHGLKVATIKDLIGYRLKADNLVKCVGETTVKSLAGGEWLSKVYINTAEYAEHLVLVKGEIGPDKPVMVRVHVLDMFNDILQEEGERAGQLEAAMKMIGAEGSGVIVIIRDIRPDRLQHMVKQRENKEAAPAPSTTLRDYGIGAQILCDLGVQDMILLSNTKQSFVGMEAYGLNIVEQRKIK